MKSDSISKKIQNSVLSSIETTGLLNSKIIVSVSGGPDSLTLLHILNKLSSQNKIQIIGAHLNHNIRGKESLYDEEHVTNIFKNLNIKYKIGNADVPKLSKDLNISIEDAARRARHEFVYETQLKYKPCAVAMGHTSDDQAESVLMHIMRGSGINGLKGMELLSTRTLSNKSINIFRPLLNFSRSNIEEYCLENNLDPVIDSTNLSSEYKRNFVRLNILPLMEEYNPAVKNSLIRLSKISSRDLDFINQECDVFWKSKVKNHSTYLSISISELLDTPEAIRSRILIKSLSYFKKTSSNISLSTIESLLSLISGETGRQLKINNILIVKQYNELLLCENQEDLIPFPMINKTIKIDVPGTIQITGWKIQTSYDTAPKEIPSSGILGGTGWIKEEFAKNLYVRSRKEGDVFYPHGLDGKKKLKTFMIDSKIPRLWRSRIPLVLKGPEIAWVVGWRIAEWAYPNPNENAVKITFDRQYDN